LLDFEINMCYTILMRLGGVTDVPERSRSKNTGR